MTRVLVVGRGRSGAAVVRFCARAGFAHTVVDDADGALDEASVVELVSSHDLVVPSPGVPEHHPLLRHAIEAGVVVRSEVDLAAEAARAPFVAVTGTNGKTTVTTLIAAMLEAGGWHVSTAGNIGTPFLDAVAEPADAYVVETSSFQLRFTTPAFVPRVAVWTNLAPDHLDWHGTMTRYADAKRQIMVHQGVADTFVFNADDPIVASAAADAPSRTVPYTLNPDLVATWRVVDGALIDPEGVQVADGRVLDLRAPHEFANVLASAAAARAMGAPDDAIVTGAARTARLPHRMAPVGKAYGVEFIDDSKATNPHAAVAAVRAFDSVVLIAGGRNKGLDLGELRAVSDRVRSVVAIGDAAAEVMAAFAGLTPVVTADSMRNAVRTAAAAAQPGDVVLLSPACASFDWYANYGERGDDFAAAVREYLEEAS